MDIVVVVDGGSVPVSRIAGFGDDIRTHQPGNAVALEDFAHHSVASPQIEHAQFGNRFANCIESTLQQIGDFRGRVAAKSLVKELLIQAGPFVDLVVIVKSQTLLFTVLDEGKEDLVLREFLGVGWRKLNSVAFWH